MIFLGIFASSSGARKRAETGCHGPGSNRFFPLNAFRDTTRRSCETLVCPGDWDLSPWLFTRGVLDSADAVLDWLLPGPVNAPTDTPKQTQLDVELIVTYPPAKECDAVALAGSKYSQNGFENARACQKGIAHIIWPHAGANQAQNKAKPDMIRSVDTSFLTSKHPQLRA